MKSKTFSKVVIPLSAIVLLAAGTFASWHVLPRGPARPAEGGGGTAPDPPSPPPLYSSPEELDALIRELPAPRSAAQRARARAEADYQGVEFVQILPAQKSMMVLQNLKKGERVTLIGGTGDGEEELAIRLENEFGDLITGASGNSPVIPEFPVPRTGVYRVSASSTDREIAVIMARKEAK